jgi:hypothetical protein
VKTEDVAADSADVACDLTHRAGPILDVVGSDDSAPFDRVDVDRHDLKALAGGRDIKERRDRCPRGLSPHDDLVAGDQQLLDLPFEVWNGLAAALDPGDDTLTRSALVVGPA